MAQAVRSPRWMRRRSSGHKRVRTPDTYGHGSLPDSVHLHINGLSDGLSDALPASCAPPPEYAASFAPFVDGKGTPTPTHAPSTGANFTLYVGRLLCSWFDVLVCVGE